MNNPKATRHQRAHLLQKHLVIPFSENTVNKKEGKNVLIISSSPRRGGNTDMLADEFARGAKETGSKFEKVFLADLNLEFKTYRTWLCMCYCNGTPWCCQRHTVYGTGISVSINK